MYELLKGTIVKLQSWKQPEGSIFEKIVHRIQFQIYRENAQQGAFTPIKFAKQPYWSKARCVITHRAARCEKQLPQRQQTLRCWSQKTFISYPTISKEHLFLWIFLFIKGWMLYCNKECLQVFSFANIHRCWHQNVPLKNMVRMLNEMFGWVWIFVWIFMLISTSNNISRSFSYAFFLKNRLPHISYMKDMGLSPSKRKAVWLIHPLFWWKHSIFSKVFGYFSIFVTERGIMENNRSWFEIIKACVRYFSSIFYF